VAASVQPDVVHGEADGLADPQARTGQQAEECGEHGRSQGPAGSVLPGGLAGVPPPTR
jgi:hypothetical protein